MHGHRCVNNQLRDMLKHFGGSFKLNIVWEKLMSSPCDSEGTDTYLDANIYPNKLDLPLQSLDSCRSLILNVPHLLPIIHACFSLLHADDFQITLPSSRWCQWHNAQRLHLTHHHPLVISWFHNAFESSCRSLVRLNRNFGPVYNLCLHSEQVKCLTAGCKQTASY